MKLLIPTTEQENIINYENNTVVIANPGSGKTFVISEKIKRILPKLLEYQGIIAISYTNKSSEELRKRSIVGGADKKASFFGTIDKFFISEIIIPFGKQLFRPSEKIELKVIKKNELSENESNKIDEILTNTSKLENADFICNLFREGNIVLETVGILANFCFDNSMACRKYLRARYTHVFIDEYQDSGVFQHIMFIKLVRLGLIGIAVGDANQSIYEFSGKSSKYLLGILKSRLFKAFPLTNNKRCHNSIVKYSLSLYNIEFELYDKNDIRVLDKKIDGSEVNIVEWIDTVIPLYKTKYAIVNNSEIGILVRGNRTGEIVNKNLKEKHKYFINTTLDDEVSEWASLFRDILYFSFENNMNIIDIIEKYSQNISSANTKKISKEINLIKKLLFSETFNSENIIQKCVQIGIILKIKGNNEVPINLLKIILASRELLNSYKQASTDEVQIMTIHKSKGLEFSLVFHLDLYEWILPNKYDGKFSNFIQDINLHYVAITRAKQCCILCTSNQRTNTSGRICNANESEFLTEEGLKILRKHSEI